MGSPPLTPLFGGAAGRLLPPSPAPERDADGGLWFRQGQPLSAAAAPPVAFAISPGFSPASLLESPRFFSPVQGHMGMSHQQALAQVTAQAFQNQSQIQIGNPVSQALEAATSSHPSQQVSLQQTHPAATNTMSSTSELLDVDYSDQKHQIPGPPVDKHVGDGYNWRKYGQKQVKGSEYPRSYYKCTHPNCPVKKKVERSLDGQVTEIIYKGQHNHQKPQSNRRGKEGAILSSGSVDFHKHVDSRINSEMRLVDEGENAKRSPEFGNSASVCRGDQELGHVLTEQFSDSADAENGDDAETDRQSLSCERDAKRRNVDTTISATRIIESSGPQKSVAEPKIIVQTTSEVDLLDDGYRWRKYGQKVVKGNPNPRSYYKCTSAGCNVRKHVERASTDSKAVVTTYEGKHNHDIPTAKNSSHGTANSGGHQSKP